MAGPDDGRIAAGREPENQEQTKMARSRPGYLRWTVALIVRLCIWYAVLTPFFHCPSNISELSESSPRVCRPYLAVRSYVDPYVNPYYQTYAAPYVDAATPYVRTFRERVYVPTSKLAKQGYDSYAEPVLNKVAGYGREQWQTVVVPKLESARQRTGDIYESAVAPQVRYAADIASPYWQPVVAKTRGVREQFISPLYVRSKPFVIKAYTTGQGFVLGTAIPYSQRAGCWLVTFVRDTVWPNIKGLYSENVEPQLIKIGARLASYRDGRKVRTAVEEPVSSITSIMSISSTSTPSTTVPTVSTQAVSSESPSTTSSDASVQKKTSLTSEEKIANAREQVASDLRNWQMKFAAAADNGIEDLSARVREIAAGHWEATSRQQGETLLQAVESVIDSELSNVRAQINNIIEGLPPHDAPEDEDAALRLLNETVRSAGVAIKDKAHALREWYNNSEQELVRKVLEAARSTVEVLDHIRDLGLQEIGMRWAWMDGVTYKDWAKYHETRKQFDAWRREVIESGLNHEKVEEVQAAAGELLSRGMTMAEDAAKELTRLKEVGRWKIAAREVSDNFETREEPPPPLPKPGTASPDEGFDSISANGDGVPPAPETDDQESGVSDASSGTHETRVDGESTTSQGGHDGDTAPVSRDASPSQSLEDVEGPTNDQTESPLSTESSESRDQTASTAADESVVSSRVSEEVSSAESGYVEAAVSSAQEDIKSALHGKPSGNAAASSLTSSSSMASPVIEDLLSDSEQENPADPLGQQEPTESASSSTNEPDTSSNADAAVSTEDNNGSVGNTTSMIKDEL